jgi:hypothetical protein
MRSITIQRGLLRNLLAVVWPAFSVHAAWAGSKSDSQDAKSLFRAGRFAEAEKVFAARNAEKPGDARTLLHLGYLALLRNDLGEAERRLQAALEIKPKIKEGPALLAEVYYRRDEFERAAPLFKKVGRTSMARKLASFAGRQPYQIDSAPSSTRLPFLRTDPLPVVGVRVNGSEPARFLIDTGGGELILDSVFAKKVAARHFGAERSYFGGGKKAPFEHGRVETVRLGGFEVRHVPVITMDLSAIGPALGEERVDGIVGTVPLYHFLSTIDYENGELVLARCDATQQEGRGSSDLGVGAVDIPFWMADDHFIVAWGAVNGGPKMLFFVDTGLAGAGFTCPHSTLKAAAIVLKKDQAASGTGGGGAIRFVPFVVDDLSLGDVRRTRIDGALGPFPRQLEWDMGFHIGGLISHQFFRPGALTLDFDAMRLRIRASTQKPD